MANYDKNLTRALAILATHPDEFQYTFGFRRLSVAGQTLTLDDKDDDEVLSILAASRELGWALTELELMTKRLRTMHQAHEKANHFLGDTIEETAA